MKNSKTLKIVGTVAIVGTIAAVGILNVGLNAESDGL
jgi:hypothetical protein